MVSRAELKNFPTLPVGRAKGKGLLLNMGARSRASLNHGGRAPIPPLLKYENGIVRRESACGGHSLCEYLLTDKTTFSFACNSDRLHHASHRVLLSAGAQPVSRECGSMYLLTNWRAMPRAGLSLAVLSVECGRDMGGHGAKPHTPFDEK